MNNPTFKVNYSLIGIQRAVLWDASYYQKLQCYFAQVRYLHHVDPEKECQKIEDLDNFIDKVYNDHKNTTFSDENIPALNASVKGNVLTSDGAVGFVAILANSSDQFFRYFGMGTSNTPPTIGQHWLLEETARVSSDTDGALTPRGNILSHVGNMGYGAPTGDIYEFGGFNAAVNGKMYFRAVLDTPLQHTQGVTFVTGSHATQFVPVS